MESRRNAGSDMPNANANCYMLIVVIFRLYYAILRSIFNTYIYLPLMAHSPFRLFIMAPISLGIYNSGAFYLLLSAAPPAATISCPLSHMGAYVCYDWLGIRSRPQLNHIC